MIFEKRLDIFCVNKNATFKELLRKLEASHLKFICVLAEKNRLLGVVSYGDVVRSLERFEFDTDRSVSQIMNTEFSYAISGIDQPSLKFLVSRHRFVPLVDEMKQLHALAYGSSTSREFRIGEHRISSSRDYILVAEIGNNHNGSLSKAKDLISAAKNSGAHIAKFQMRDLSIIYGEECGSEDLSTEYVINLLRKVSLSVEDMFRCFDHCRKQGIMPLCTPFDLESLEQLEKYGIEGYKIASADLTNQLLYEAVIETAKPVIASTGMSTDEDIDAALSLLEKNHVNYALLHTNSTYPAPYTDVHLNYLHNLKKRTSSVVGYSGHERGWHIPLAAFSLGAQVIEKHFTLDKNLEGSDHKVSLLPEEFRSLREQLDNLADSLGDGHKRFITQGESNNKVALAKSLFCAKSIKVGERITEPHLVVRSPGNGVSPRYYEQLIGKIAVRDVEPGQAFYMEDLRGMSHGRVDTVPLWFKWCIPVRHRDVYQLFDVFAPPAIEFHLSFKDLDLVDEEILNRQLDTQVIVHAPEQFDKDFIVDLFSTEESIAKQSIALLNSVFEKAARIGQLINSQEQVQVIVNCGGHSPEGFMNSNEIDQGIELFKTRFDSLERRGCRFLAQTMPPYPWHFGGQSFHNQFTSSENIWEILNATGTELELCLDVSHSFMWCNHLGENFYDFVSSVLDRISHLHISDASGTMSEGLQIGLGDIDFFELCERLKGYEKKVTLLPEIWQGHENQGAGFQVALKRLQEMGY